MELWIRSQKNEKLRQGLFKVNEIELGDYDDDMNCLVANNLYCIGIYKSKERALEVLDEIQKLLMPTIEYNPVVKKEESWEEEYQRTILKGYDVKIEQAITYVYEMPKE